MDIVSPTLDVHGSFSSDDSPEMNIHVIMAVDVALIVIIVASIIGNLLVCFAVGLDPVLRKPSNVFIASLALADLLVAVLVMPFSLSTYIIHRSIFGPAFCKAWIAFDVTFSATSVIHLCAISIDRYIHIKEPFKYKRWMTNKVAVMISVMMWIVKSLSTFVPVSLGWNEVEKPLDDSPNTTSKAQYSGDMSDWQLAGFIYCDHSFNQTYSIISSIVDFYVPTCILLLIYSRLFHLIQTRNRKLRNGHLSCRGSGHEKDLNLRVSKQQCSHHKAALTLGAIIGLFLICWTPFFLNLFICSFLSCSSFSSKKKDEVLTWLGYLNSCMNPCVYAISNPEFRQSFKDLVHHKPKSWVMSRTRNLSARYRRNTRSRTVQSKL